MSAAQNSACRTCGRHLEIEVDPMSVDCGGDCWGCIGLFEVEMGAAPEDDIRFAREISLGWRTEDGYAKPQAFFIANPAKPFSPK